MTDIEQKALIERLRQRSNSKYMLMSDPPKPAPDRDCHAAADLLEQLLPIAQEFNDFRQEVSDVVEQALSFGDVESLRRKGVLSRFIIPKPKPDPLVKIMEALDGEWTPNEYAETIRAALDALGFEIREKGQ